MTPSFEMVALGLLVVLVALDHLGAPSFGRSAVVAGGFLAAQGVLGFPGVLIAAIATALVANRVVFAIGGTGSSARFIAFLRLEGDLVPAPLAWRSRFTLLSPARASLAAGLWRQAWSAFAAVDALATVPWMVVLTAVGAVAGWVLAWVDARYGAAVVFGLGTAVLLAAAVVVWPKQRRAPEWLERGALATSLVLTLGLFLRIARGLTHEWTRFDEALVEAARALQGAGLTVLMRGVTALGSPLALTAAVLVVSLVVWRRRRRWDALLLAVSALLTTAVVLLLKAAFHRARPDLWPHVLEETFSFPSAHAMGSAALYGAVAVVLGRAFPRWRWPVAAAAVVLVLAIGFSRVYLGVHWPTDVLAGFIGGLTVVVAITRVLRQPVPR